MGKRQERWSSCLVSELIFLLGYFFRYHVLQLVLCILRGTSCHLPDILSDYTCGWISSEHLHSSSRLCTTDPLRYILLLFWRRPTYYCCYPCHHQYYSSQLCEEHFALKMRVPFMHTDCKSICIENVRAGTALMPPHIPPEEGRTGTLPFGLMGVRSARRQPRLTLLSRAHRESRRRICDDVQQPGVPIRQVSHTCCIIHQALDHHHLRLGMFLFPFRKRFVALASPRFKNPAQRSDFLLHTPSGLSACCALLQ